MLGDNSECDPPEPIPNSEVKPLSANDSVGSSHVKVGHRQAPVYKGKYILYLPFFMPGLFRELIINLMCRLTYRKV